MLTLYGSKIALGDAIRYDSILMFVTLVRFFVSVLTIYGSNIARGFGQEVKGAIQRIICK